MWPYNEFLRSSELEEGDHRTMLEPKPQDEQRPGCYETLELYQGADTRLESAEVGCQLSSGAGREHIEDTLPTREEDALAEGYSICNSNQVDLDGLLMLISPLMVSMRICGLHYTRGRSAVTDKDTDNGRKVTPGMVYATVLLCLLWIDFARNLSVFSSGISIDVDFFNKLLFVFWNMLVCANFTTCYYSSLNNKFVSFLETWIQLVPKNSLHHGHIRRSALVLVVGSWTLVIANMVYSAWSIYQSTSFDDQYTPFDVDHDQIDILRAALLVVHLMRTCAWVFSAAFFCMISYMLQWQFNKLTEEFVRQKHQQFIFRRLECFRQTHQKMCTMADFINGCVSPLIAAQFACNIGLICIILYILILSESPERSSKLTRYFWLISSAGSMLVFCIGSAKVNTAVSMD